MKRLLSASYTLWRQALLWRSCVVLCTVNLTMAAFFPTHFLKAQFPWLPGPIFTDTDKAPSWNASNAPIPPDGNGPASPLHLPVQLHYPELSETITGHVTLGKHTLLLPHGTWHPVLSAQVNDTSPYSFLALIRTDQGAITGLLVVQATQQPIPLEQVSSETDICHDDRNYMNSIFPTEQATEDCSALRLITLHGPTPSDSLFTNEAIARLKVMGFPIPPLFIAAQWRHIEATNDSRAQAGTMDLLIPPLDTQTHQLLAPPDSWPKEVLPSNPTASAFINRMRKWLPRWQKILQAGFEDQLDDSELPENTLRDPMAPMHHQVP